MIRQLISLYLPSYPTVLVYMLQGTEYQELPYLKWVWRTKDYTTVMKRRTLERTRAARLLLWAVRLGIVVQIGAGLALIYLGLMGDVVGGVVFGLALILLYPFVWAHLLLVPVILGRWFISGPAEGQQIAESEPTFAGHSGHKIAIVGSYGKTTMKELLLTVLDEGLKSPPRQPTKTSVSAMPSLPKA